MIDTTPIGFPADESVNRPTLLPNPNQQGEFDFGPHVTPKVDNLPPSTAHDDGTLPAENIGIMLSEDGGSGDFPKTVEPKAGSVGGKGAKKAFSPKVKVQARNESNDTCVLCGTKTTREPGPTRSEIDHSIPKPRGGNNTIENAQNTCRTCNRSKGAKTTEEFLNR